MIRTYKSPEEDFHVSLRKEHGRISTCFGHLLKLAEGIWLSSIGRGVILPRKLR